MSRAKNRENNIQAGDRVKILDKDGNSIDAVVVRPEIKFPNREYDRIEFLTIKSGTLTPEVISYRLKGIHKIILGPYGNVFWDYASHIKKGIH